MNRIKKVALVCLSLLLTGCALNPSTGEAEKSEQLFNSMEEEPDLTYEVPVSSPNILVNQLGYISESTKTAIFCGEEAPREFYIVDKDTNKVVFTGEIEEEGYNEDRGEYINYGDFSEFTIAGSYYIEAPILGRSYSFEIGDDIYDVVFSEACRQYFYNRCGMTLTAEYAGERAHNACHTGKAVLREDISVNMDVSGGWHQDEMGSKDVVKAAENISVMLLAYELYSEPFGDDLGIPESGNGIPDILDEIKYEVEWLLKMQNDQTGAVYSGVTVYEQGVGKGVVSYVEPADMESTKAFSMAVSKFCYLYKNYDSVYATNCLKQADRAWKYVELNDGENMDEWRFAAAAELYRVSGQQSCHQYIERYLASEGEKELDEVTFLGYITYISTKQRVNVSLCDEIARKLMKKGEEVCEQVRVSKYLLKETGSKENNQKLLQNMMYLTAVDYMISNHEYENMIENHLHYFMGRNTYSICYIDNIGEYNYVKLDDNMGIMRQFDADSKLIFMLSDIVQTHRKS